jgi:hypothetical protein
MGWMGNRNTPGNQGGGKKKHIPDPPRPPKKVTRTTHPALLWGRGIGISSLCIGGAGIVTEYFWWSSGLIYTGLLLIGVDLYFEPWFAERWPRRTIGISTVALLISLFSFGVVFTPAPLIASVDTITVPHFPGSSFGGIRWTEKMTDVRVLISNDTDQNYQDVDITVGIDKQIIVGVGQLQSLPECHLSPAVEAQVSATLTDSTGSHLIFPPSGRSLGVGYRIVCKSFPSHTGIALVIAVENATRGAVTFSGTYKAGLRIRNVKDYLRQRSVTAK